MPNSQAPTRRAVFSLTISLIARTNGTLTGSETYRFTGKPSSSATGVYYYQRWYDPSVGRFITVDPFAGFLSDPQSLNYYVYASDTPTTVTDSSGLTVYAMKNSACPGM